MAAQLEVKYMNELKGLVEDLEINTVKFDKNNLTAGRRARGISMKIKHMMTDFRKDVLEETKTRQSEKSNGGSKKLETITEDTENVVQDGGNTENVKETEEVVQDGGNSSNTKKKAPKKATTKKKTKK